MRLHRSAFDAYIAYLETDPPVDSWEASFDAGATWQPGVEDPERPNHYQFGVAGPDVPVLEVPAGYTVIRKPEELPARLPMLYAQLTAQ